MSSRYKCSEELLARAEKVIPLGSQTFSKSKTQFPFGASPYFIKRGEGAYVWDVDGNKYIDFISSLAAITLGYNDPDVVCAVEKQMKEGVIFSLPHTIEIDVAEKICEMVPCAEKVRFGKNGSDATAGAIRLARAYTNREHVAVCGYHGWQDWYIGSTARNLGVPESTQKLTHTFYYNDIDSLQDLFDKFPDEIAAVILEPMNVFEPEKDFLQHVKELAARNNAVLIFDETVTGFRFSNGGAQEYFGVIPDLATFGKGLANGYPLSAITGRAEIMNVMEDIFFSFTFGGETLSLAAALATMEKLQNEPVIESIRNQGTKIISGVDGLIKKYKLDDILSIEGNPVWSFLIFKDCEKYNQFDIKTLFMQEMLSRGFLTFGSHNLSYSHGDNEIASLLSSYEEVLPLIKTAIDNSSLNEMLNCEKLKPLFKVR